MKFAQDSLEEGYVITAYDDNSVSVNGKIFSQSLVISIHRLHEEWDITSISLLTEEHIDRVLTFEPELILIGTGSKLVFPPAESYSKIIEHGVAVDFMDTGAACRTYNILMSEGRDVVAGLII